MVADLQDRIRLIGERLALLNATASVSRPDVFFYPWVDVTEDVAGLKRIWPHPLVSRWYRRKEMLQEDLERVPVMLKTPLTSGPFELFVRLLPCLPTHRLTRHPSCYLLPRLFGMILGDAGYGLFLLVMSLCSGNGCRNKNHKGWGTILFISSDTQFFSALYGSSLATCTAFFGIEPICVERRTAVIPMLYFTLTVGMLMSCSVFSSGS